MLPMFGGRRLGTTIVVALLLCLPKILSAQTFGTLEGRVLDATGAVVIDAIVRVQGSSSGFDVSVRTDAAGRYHVLGIPAGTYIVTVQATSFRVERIDALRVDVGRTVVRDFHLSVSDVADAVVVRTEVPLVDRGTATVGHVVTAETIQAMPLNGRHFTDLGLLVPGSVAPSQTGFSSRPIRGVGALAFNTAGNREESVAFVVNGVSTNNLTFGSLIFEPPLTSIQEFKVDNSVFSVEQGHVSGAVVNIATRSGTDRWRGESFEFFRNDALDAPNYFEGPSNGPHPFNRNQFGGSVGGPIQRGRTFFFAAYEGLRQRQGVDLNSLVPSDAQRASVTDPVIRSLLPLIPHANVFDADGTPRFLGSAPAVADTDRWTLDLQHNAGPHDRVHVFFGSQHVRSVEPAALGNSIPGFGSVSHPSASILTVSETHTFGTSMLNEARFGRSHLTGGTFPAAPLNPADYNIADGVTRAIGLPQMVVAGDLNFGGPGTLPQGRIDTSYVFIDTVSRAVGRHALTGGAEYRYFVNENFAEGTGTFNFPTMDAFLAGTANAFNITLGERRSVVDQPALGVFLQDQFALRDNLTVEVGLRYEWHITPTERDNRFVVFDAATASLLRVGVDVTRIYRQNAANLGPRAGIAWNLSHDGRTVLRAAYGRAFDEPGTTAVRDTAGNPPFAMPLTASGSIPLAGAVQTTAPAGLAPLTIDPGFRNASVHAWNVNLQRQLAGTLGLTLGYSGSHGTHLRISRNVNQPIEGVRPFTALASSSPILPGTPLGNITQVESTGFSNYEAGWAAITKRLSHGLQLDASYTWSKALDTNSLNSQGFAVQDAYDIPSQYGLSDFDARHRFVLSTTYELPFGEHPLTRGWQVAGIVQFQSGNPVNIVTSNSTLNGVPNTVRPDLTGPIQIIGAVDRWFDPSVFVAANHFGNLPRNAVRGPAFNNTDVSIMRNATLGQGANLQVRVDIFDVFNHVNFASPGNIVGSPTFAKITKTRLPTGEAGSSRQIQLAVRLAF